LARRTAYLRDATTSSGRAPIRAAAEQLTSAESDRFKLWNRLPAGQLEMTSYQRESVPEFAGENLLASLAEFIGRELWSRRSGDSLSGVSGGLGPDELGLPRMPRSPPRYAVVGHDISDSNRSDVIEEVAADYLNVGGFECLGLELVRSRTHGRFCGSFGTCTRHS
jgi:hypothetical protein